jgi:pilus assembly protein CpaC
MKKLRVGVWLLFLLVAVTCLKISASEPQDNDGELRLYTGETKVLQVNNPTRIVIGNPAIIDVANVSKNDVMVNPKSPGKTTLVIWDNFGEKSYLVQVAREDLRDIKERIDSLLETLKIEGVYTQAVDEEGKVLLLGSVKTPQVRERIFVALATLKDRVVDLIEIKEEEAVVEIDVQILELNKDATNTLGLTWPGAINLIEKGSPGISDAGTKWSTLFKVLNLQRGTSAGADPFTFKLDMLVQEGKARVLSRPRLACQSGKEAELLVGGEKPVLTTEVVQNAGTGTNVEYKEYGIKLNIKPVVNADNRIKLALKVEVSDVGTAETLGTATQTTAKAYPLIKRNASTELFLDDGQTLAIGGLIKQKSEEEIRKVPWLGDVPILGTFFRKKTAKTGGGYGEKGDTELFITLTPRIVTTIDKEIKLTEQESIQITPDKSPLAKANTGVSVEQNNLIPNKPVPEKVADPILEYAGIVQKNILKNLTYPANARSANMKGALKLGLHIDYNGTLLDAIVKESSGYKVLDNQALSVAKGIGSFPPFPTSIDKDDLWIEIPIVYHPD